MTDQEIFDLARALRATLKTDTVESVGEWRAKPIHPVTKTIRIRTGIDITIPERSWYRRGRFGVVHCVYNHIGGTETWVREFAKYVQNVVGLATLNRSEPEIGIPAYSGEGAISAIVEAADIVLIWGMTHTHERLFKKTRSDQRFIAVCHGAENSDWAMNVFRDQLSWCDGGVAVNEHVAKKFGVRYIPNMVSETERSKCRWMQRVGKKVVLWNHRPSPEKRPELALEIAKRLPPEWKLVGTFGELRVPEGVENIRFITDERQKDYWLTQAEVFLATPTDEGFGYSVAEAVEACLPVVSSPHGIANDFCRNLVSSADPNEWVEAIVDAAEMTARVRAFYRNSLLENYGPSKVAPMWESL